MPPCSQDIEPVHRLVDDRQVVGRVIYGRRPSSRNGQVLQRRERRLPVGAHLFVVVPVEVDLITPRRVGFVQGIAEAQGRTLFLGTDVVTLAHGEEKRERVGGTFGDGREGDDLVAYGHYRHVQSDHRPDVAGATRTSRVHYPLRLEGAPRGMDCIAAIISLDVLDFAHLKEVHRLRTHHRISCVAGRYRWMYVPVIRGVRRTDEAIPVQVWEALFAFLGLDPLILDARCSPHLYQA